MAKHTPTPWCVEDPMGPDQLWLVEAGKQTYEWRCIAIVASDDPINDEDRDSVEPISMAEMEANAAFIVKACNNHDALVDALRTLDTLLDFGDEALETVWTFEDLTSIQAAFDKARAALDQVTDAVLIPPRHT